MNVHSPLHRRRCTVTHAALEQLADGASLVRSVARAGETGACDLVIRDGKIAEIRKTAGVAAYVCLPPLADLHVHACRAFMMGDVFPRDLRHAVELTQSALLNCDARGFAQHAERLFRRGVLHGTTRMRSHADIDKQAGLAAVRGTLAAARAVGDAMKVEVVAFATARCKPWAADEQAMLRDAVAEGARYIGGAMDFYDEPDRAIHALLNLAAELKVGVDVHIDEHLDPARSLTGRFAQAVAARPEITNVTIGHGCAVATLSSAERARTLDALRSAKITVVALPATNLFLQDRQGGTSRRRGLTCVSEMQAAGIPVRFASDNVRDPFYPFGDADLLEVATLASITGQITDPQVLLAGICDGRTTVQEGDPADFVFMPGADFAEVLSTRPVERTVVRAGKLVTSSFVHS